jgi:hypothetical protein
MRLCVNKAAAREAGFTTDSTVSSYLLDGVTSDGRAMALAGTRHRRCGCLLSHLPPDAKLDARDAAAGR